MYKKVLILVVCISCSFFACQPDKATQKSVKKEVNTTPPPKLTVEKDFLAKNLPKLHKMVKQQGELQTSLNDYAFKIYHAKEMIQTATELEKIFTQRTTLIQEVHEKVLEPFIEQQAEFLFDEALEKELNTIGMQGIYAEGMYIELGEGELLTEQLTSLASEPFKLYMEFQAARSTAIGGEYPFLDLTGERKMVHLGETLMTKYPDHKYTAAIKEEFFNMLDILTDVHNLNDKEQVQLIYGELYTDLYPFMTEAREYDTYVNTYPKSVYTKAIQAIIANPSSMTPKGNAWENIYLISLGIEKAVKTEDGVSCEAAKLKKYAYLQQGIDVAHVLRLREGDTNICAIVYRFFSDKEKAKKAFIEFTAKHPDLKPFVKEIIYDKKEYVWELK